MWQRDPLFIRQLLGLSHHIPTFTFIPTVRVMCISLSKYFTYFVAWMLCLNEDPIWFKVIRMLPCMSAHTCVHYSHWNAYLLYLATSQWSIRVFLFFSVSPTCLLLSVCSRRDGWLRRRWSWGERSAALSQDERFILHALGAFVWVLSCVKTRHIRPIWAKHDSRKKKDTLNTQQISHETLTMQADVSVTSVVFFRSSNCCCQRK